MEENKQALERSAKHTLYMPVYTIQEGLHIGNVKMIVIDPKEKSVIAFITEKRKMSRDERIIPIELVTSIGEDVVTIDKFTYAEKRTNTMEKSSLAKIMLQLRQPIHIMGSRIFTIGGKTLGRVEDFGFDPTNGKIISLEVSDGSLLKEKLSIKGDHIITIAPNTIMLSDEAMLTMKPIENNLLSTMESAKNKANSAIEAAGKFSKNIGKNIGNRTEKQTEEKKEKTASEEALTIEADSVNMNSEATVEVSIEVEKSEAEILDLSNLPKNEEELVFAEDVEDIETILKREILEANDSDDLDQEPIVIFIDENGKEIQPQTKINFVSMKRNKLKEEIKTAEKVSEKSPVDPIQIYEIKSQSEPLPEYEKKSNSKEDPEIFTQPTKNLSNETSPTMETNSNEATNVILEKLPDQIYSSTPESNLTQTELNSETIADIQVKKQNADNFTNTN